MLGTNGPILLEGSGTLDRRFIDASALIDCVSPLIRSEVSFRGPWFVWFQSSVRIDDVILDEWICGPTIKR